jgi:hypothetical protein
VLLKGASLLRTRYKRKEKPCKVFEYSAAAIWNGCKVIGIIDRDGGLINENGFTLKK